MITIQGLTKSFGPRTVLSDIGFVAEDGRVTGFLGPNGAGKSTTMRALLGLIRPDSGAALIDGQHFAESSSPMSLAGAVLDAKSAHRGRTAYDYLRSLALTNGIERRRVDEVIEQCGLSSVRSRRAGTFSLGMSQRLSIAAALLADPHNLILDEPINGLDPEGVRWVRDICRYYASQGRAVLLSSHLMSEVSMTADDLVIIARGRILHTSTVPDFVSEHSMHALRVATPDCAAFTAAMEALPDAQVTRIPPSPDDPERCMVFRVLGVPVSELAGALMDGRVVVHELVEERTSLESAYLELTRGQGDYASHGVGGAAPIPDRSAMNGDMR